MHIKLNNSFIRIILKVGNILILLLSMFPLFAQVHISNTVVNLSQNTTLATPNTILNNGNIINNGHIFISANWYNYGNYNESQGSISFEGSETQLINHNNQRIYNLIVTGSDKYIENNLTITGTLELISGILTPINDNIILLEQNAQISGASEYSYISGAFYNSGSGDKTYPIGKNGNYYPVELLDIRGSNPVTGIEAFEPNPDPQYGQGINYVSNEIYWQKTVLSGTFEGAYISITNPPGSITNIEDIVIAESDLVGGVFSSIGNRSNTPGILQSELLFSQNVFSLAELEGLSIKNVITPNNDGLNDYLIISNIENYPDNEIIIISRAGNMVYSQKNYDNSWDAKVNGKVLPTGTYTCILKIGQKVYRQSISVLR